MMIRILKILRMFYLKSEEEDEDEDDLKDSYGDL